MPRTSKARVFRSTQTAPNTGTIRDLQTAFGTAANDNTRAGFTGAAGPSTIAWDPNVRRTTADTIPTAGTLPTGAAIRGWRDTTSESAESVRYDAGNWTVRTRIIKSGQTLVIDLRIRITVVVYYTDSTGALVAEIGRVQMADTLISTAVLSISGSFNPGVVTVPAGGRIHVQAWCQNVLTGGVEVGPPADAVDFAFRVDETSANSGASFTAIPGHQILYDRSFSEAIPTTDALARRTGYARGFTESIPTTETLARVKGANRSLSESIPTTEALTRRLAYGRSLVETIPTTESLARSAAYARSLSEAIPTTDALARRAAYGRSLVETIPTIESLARVKGANRSLSESIPTTDALSRVAAYKRALSESIPTIDSLSRAVGYSRTMSEDLGGGGDAPVTPADIAAIANAVWDELTAEARAVGSYGAVVRDRIDAAVSSRSSQASVTALGSPAQAPDVATLLDRLTAARAVALDLLDAAVSSRASASTLASVQALVDDLEVRLSAARAALLDNLDAAVSSRARPSDVAITVVPQPSGVVS